MENIINEKDFKENLLWDSKLAKKDFYHIKNNNLNFTYTWILMKYYLMLKIINYYGQMIHRMLILALEEIIAVECIIKNY